MTARSSELAPWKALLLAALAAGAVLALEQGSRAQLAWRRFGSPLSRALPQDLTRTSLLAAMGSQSRVAADWAYIDCLQYLGEPANAEDADFGRVLRLYTEVLWLDPGFSHAGREGVSVLGWGLKRPIEAAELIRSARAWDPLEARYPAYLAALGFQRKLDPAGVIEALRPELNRPDVPLQLLRMAGNVYLQAHDTDGAVTYWRWVLQRTQDPLTVAAARRGLEKALAMRRADQAPAKPKKAR
jgi:hypothetical protein